MVNGMMGKELDLADLFIKMVVVFKMKFKMANGYDIFDFNYNCDFIFFAHIISLIMYF